MCMIYVLVLIGVLNSTAEVETLGTFTTMQECFQAREQVVESIGRPIINYQAVCVLHKHSQ